MAFRTPSSLTRVVILMIVAVSTITSANGAAIDPCTLDTAATAAQSCVKALNHTDTLVIDCGSTGSASFKPGNFSSPSDQVCKVALTNDQCPAASQVGFSTLIPSVGVSKTGNSVTITAPSPISTTVTAHGACTNGTATMAISVTFNQSGAADVFGSALPTALLAVLISSIYIVS